MFNVDTKLMKKMDILALKNNVNLEFKQPPIENRIDSFWYDGDVAILKFTAKDGEERTMILTAQGEKSGHFFDDATCQYKDYHFVEEAERREYSDKDISIEGEKVNMWDTNWFEFWWGSSTKWKGYGDISVMDGMEIIGDYENGIKTGIQIITDDALWNDITEPLHEVKSN